MRWGGDEGWDVLWNVMMCSVERTRVILPFVLPSEVDVRMVVVVGGGVCGLGLREKMGRGIFDGGEEGFFFALLLIG